MFMFINTAYRKKFIAVLTAFLLIILLILLILSLLSSLASLSSCSKKSVAAEDEAAADAPGIIPAIYINASNKGIIEQSVSDLYGNVEMSDIKKKTLNTDPFNLKLSHNNYFYTDDIYVEITSDIEDAEIYYTLNGANPVKDMNGKNNVLYEKPVLLEAGDSNKPYILKVTAFSEDSQSHMLTHTYFISSQIANRFSDTVYVVSISSDPRNLFDYDYGILVEGRLRDEWQQANPGQWASPPEPANYNLRSREGERGAHIEMFKSDGKLIISQGAGIRVHGGWSRAANKKSLALYARNEYDAVFDRFYYPFFDGKTRNDEYKTFLLDYKTLLLRNGANDREGSNMREEFVQALAKKAGLPDYRDFAPAAVYLNGEYYGFFWLETFYHESYFLDMYGGDNKDLIELLEWAEPEQRIARNITDDEVFKEYSENVLDIDNYLLYYAIQIYGTNWDWPHNNRKYWRYSAEGGADINKYYDGRFRSLFYDGEGAWGMYGGGYRERTIRRIRDSAPVFTALMKRPDMVEKFCNQMFDLINTVFSYDSIEEEYNKIIDAYDAEIRYAIRKKVISGWYNADQLDNERKAILNYAGHRAEYVIKDMSQSFDLQNATYGVRVTGKAGADVTLNTLKLSGEGTVSSCYFTGHYAELTARPHPGKIFYCWKINGAEYKTPVVTLKNSLAVNGGINAELVLKNDASYADCVFSQIQLDSDYDMIQLHNPGRAETVLENAYISNDINNLRKFYIKKVTFPPNSVITYYGMNYYGYAREDNKNNRDNKNGETGKINENRVFDFKIKPGDTIYISSREGEIITSLYIPKRFNPDRGEKIARQSDGSYNVVKINKD